jgi:Na+-transporting methylmalonyl-CoA/oxaloacetate decarboxylase gamma subunit
MSNASIFRTLTLKTYGDALSGGSVGTWMGIARLIMYIMAGVEFASWTYAATYLTSNESFRWPLACGIGFVMLVLVLLIDVTLLTAPVRRLSVDLKPKSTKATEERVISEDHSLSRKFSPSVKFYSSVGLRIVLALASVYVMSPFLNLAVFEKDISQNLEVRRTALLDKKEEELRAVVLAAKSKADALSDPVTSEIAKLQEQSRALAAQYASEIDGKGGSNAVGVGPIARAIAQQKADIDSGLLKLQARLEDERKLGSAEVLRPTEELQRFRDARAGRNDELLHNKYGITVSPNSLSDRLEVFRKESQKLDPDRTIQWIVVAFQLFIIVALLLMKIFEPDDVSLYFNSDIQNCFVLFNSGRFDHVPETVGRSSIRTPISPSLFVGIYSDAEAKLSLNQEEVSERSAMRKREDSLAEKVESASRMIDIRNHHVEKRNLALQAARLEVLRLRAIQAKFLEDAARLESATAEIIARVNKGSSSREENSLDNDRIVELRSKITSLKAQAQQRTVEIQRGEQMERIAHLAYDDAVRSFETNI